MTDRDPIDMLGRTVPFAAGPDAAVEHDPAAQALFEEIIVQTHTTRRPVWQRPVPVIGAAAAATVLLVGGAITIGGDGPPSAYAQVVDATEAIASAPSGVVTVEVDLREDRREGEAGETGTIAMAYTFAGEDYDLQMMYDIWPIGDSAESADSEVVLQMQTRVVDDVAYISLDGVEGWTSRPLFEEEAPAGGFLGFSPDDGDPELVLALVQAASDVTEVSTVDGVATFAGTVAATAIEALDGLPAGLAMLSSEPGLLPQQVQLTVEVADDRLRSIRLDAVGAYPGDDISPGGYIDASITTTYSRMGDDIVIELPPADEVIESDPAEVEMMERSAIVGAAFQEYPECIEASDDGSDREGVDPDSPPIDEEATGKAYLEAVATCLESVGELEAAEAWREMNAAMQDLGTD
jgi:hypothetical protein